MTLAQSIFTPCNPCSAAPSGCRNRKGAFTLIEIMVAAIAASIILVAIYGIFYRAIKMRDNATERTRDARLRARALNVIRNDLKNALVSGGILASTLQGDSNSTDSTSTNGADAAFPGYLKFTTTTGKDTLAVTGTGATMTGTNSTNETYGDVQQVEYYIEKDQSGSGMSNAGTLVRVVTRDLLNANPIVIHEEQLLSNVQSLQVSFYDGTQWQTTWQISGTSTTSGTGSTTSGTAATSGTYAETLPAAVRVDIQQAAPTAKGPGGFNKVQQPAPPPLEILVPWATAPFLSGTNYIIGSGSATSPLPQE